MQSCVTPQPHAGWVFSQLVQITLIVATEHDDVY